MCHCGLTLGHGQAPRPCRCAPGGKERGACPAGVIVITVWVTALSSAPMTPITIVATVFGVDGDTLIFERSALETGSYDHWVNRKTGEYRNMSSIPTPPIKTDAKGSCKEAPFTAFGVDLNDAAKAAHN